MALDTICEALFPGDHRGQFGADWLDLENEQGVMPDLAETLVELDREEAGFAERVQKLMDARGMTQKQLAELADVGQPAISMMLARQCRPQLRTVAKIAKALGVKPDELWPHGK